jgi:hypothetical protein
MRIEPAAIHRNLPLAMQGIEGYPVLVADDGSESDMPEELRTWLVRLRLLEGVPFANLVADTELLPEESIRWFYLDRRWTDALVEGALSVGTVNTDDRMQLTTQYPAIRAALDQEERNYRRRPGTPRFGGSVQAVSGFILRSKAVSGWPGLHVRAYTVDPPEPDGTYFAEDDSRRMRLLRLERLAPAVLFCMFDGIPQAVHIEEPRQGVQFGFDLTDEPGGASATLTPRNIATFDDVPHTTIDVPFRATAGATGVVDIQALEKTLVGTAGAGVGGSLDSAEYALELIRFPYRQIFGDPRKQPKDARFAPSLGYAELVKRARMSREVE